MTFLRPFVPLPSLREFDRNVEVIRKVPSQVIASRRSNPKELEEGKDLLSILLREKSDFSDEELVEQVLTFLGAGHETTSVVSTWILMCLSQYPEIQEKLRQEIISNFGNASQEQFTYTAVNNLEYLDAVVKEVLRLYPPVPSSSRECAKDWILPSGQLIPRGTNIVILPYFMHYRKDIWGQDAESFRPERWLEKDWSKVENFNTIYMPFMAGPHSCIGNKLALVEVKLIIINLLKEFSFTIDPKVVYRGVRFLTLRPDPDVLLRVSKLIK